MIYLEHLVEARGDPTEHECRNAGRNAWRHKQSVLIARQLCWQLAAKTMRNRMWGILPWNQQQLDQRACVFDNVVHAIDATLATRFDGLLRRVQLPFYQFPSLWEAMPISDSDGSP